MRKSYVGLNLLDRLIKADSVKEMLRIIKPCLERDRYKLLKRAVKTQISEERKRECIINYAKQTVYQQY